MAEWTKEQVAKLRVLWAEGLSMSDIGARLGFSKNAVVGKAHRLDLPSRDSPIKRVTDPALVARNAEIVRLADSGKNGKEIAAMMSITPAVAYDVISKHNRKLRPPATTLPALPSVIGVKPVPAARPVPRAAIAPVVSGGDRVVARSGRVIPCCWPIGEPGKKGFRYCDDSSEPGRPYCEEHAGIAYVKPRVRWEDAA